MPDELRWNWLNNNKNKVNNKCNALESFQSHPYLTPCPRKNRFPRNQKVADCCFKGLVWLCQATSVISLFLTQSNRLGTLITSAKFLYLCISCNLIIPGNPYQRHRSPQLKGRGLCRTCRPGGGNLGVHLEAILPTAWFKQKCKFNTHTLHKPYHKFHLWL